jgi:hypothetical protein
MSLPQARFGSLLASLLVLGCGSTSGAPKDGGAGGSLGGAGGGTGGLGGAAGSGTAGAPMPTGSLVFMGDDPRLLTQGLPCTWEEGATGDRWCAFVAASVTNPNNGDLFVVNVTKAAAGVSITCGATDANCIKLTSSYGENDIHPAMFGGDTLVYYELTGTPFGWRPGMTAGRALATADPNLLDVVLCTPSPKGTAVYCLRLLPPAMQTDPTLTLTDLLVGKLDGAANPPLARVETVIAGNDADVRFPHFQVGFPVPGSETIAWSARATAAGPEILKMQTIGNDASRVTVATNVNSWSASPDGARWYWLSAVNETSGAGALQSAPYPAGTSPVAIAPSVSQYDFPTPTSLLVVATDTAKSLLVFADPVGAPTTSTSVDTGVTGLAALSPQGHVGYYKMTSSSASGTLFTDLFIKKTDGTGACTITSATDTFAFAIFTPSAGGLVWIQRGATALQAQFTKLSDCSRMSVGSGVDWTEPIGEHAILFRDGVSSITQTGALKFRTLAGGAISADPAAQISAQVRTWMVLPAGGADVVVYTVNGGGNDDGVYVRAFGP